MPVSVEEEEINEIEEDKCTLTTANNAADSL